MEQPNLPTPHNNLFAFTFSHLASARSLIETQLPKQVTDELLLDTLSIANASFVDPNLREKHSDLLLSVQLARPIDSKRNEALIYFLFEHKSEPESLTVLQLLSYIIRIWEQRLREGKPLCPIIPLVVYHGDRAWTVARSLEDLIPVPDKLMPYMVRFGFPLMDLTVLSDDEIVGDTFMQMTLHLLKYGRRAELKNKIHRILAILASSPIDIDLHDWIQAIGVYVMSVSKVISQQELNNALESVWPNQFEPGSLADQLYSKGIEQGVLMERIRMCQSILRIPETLQAELLSKPIDELTVLAEQLQISVRTRAN